MRRKRLIFISIYMHNGLLNKRRQKREVDNNKKNLSKQKRKMMKYFTRKST